MSKRNNMIFYNSRLAKWFLGKRKHFFMITGLCFTRYRYLEVWEDMELRIHEKQFFECWLLAVLPALILSIFLSWWWMIIPFILYDLLYWLEVVWRHHSSFDWEAIEHCGDSLYLRKRKSYAWMNYYGRRLLPKSEWDDEYD